MLLPLMPARPVVASGYVIFLEALVTLGKMISSGEPVVSHTTSVLQLSRFSESFGNFKTKIIYWYTKRREDDSIQPTVPLE